MDNQEPQTIKLVVVGNRSVGKTCITLSYITDKFPEAPENLLVNLDYQLQMEIDDQIVIFNIDERHDEIIRFRRMVKPFFVDIFLIIFSVVDKQSFENALKSWYPSLNEQYQNIPKIFVGNKIDMRNDQDSNHIRKEEANQLICGLNCKYLECSALTQEGLKNVFDEAIRVGLMAKKYQNQEQKKQQGQKEEKACCKLM